MSERPLPERDETIEALAPAARTLLAALWRGRSAHELEAGAAFALVQADLVALDADPVVLAMAARAVADEPRHAALCGRLATLYGAPDEPLPAPVAVELPRHEGADPELRRHLHVTAMSCINETIACAFVEACLAEAEGPLVRAIHREHLADEIQHARLGWAHLASARVDDRVRAGLTRWLPRLLEANVALWRRRIAELPADGVPGHALPPSRVLDAAVVAAVRDLVRPGFAHVGVAA